MTTTQAVEKFLVGYFGISTRTIKTQSAYSFDLIQFRDFVGHETELCSIRPETLEAWATHLKNRPYAVASIRRKFASVRLFFSYWVRREAISSSPMWRLRLSLGKEKALPRSLSPADSRLLIEQVWRECRSSVLKKPATRQSRFLQLRDIAIVETMFATGMRVGEIVKLRISDWNPEDSHLLVRGKGGRERLAFLPDDRSLRALTLYVELRQKNCLPNDPLFINAMGRGISEQGIAMTLARIAKNAQLPTRVTPHMIRHTVATLLLRYGADLRIVQEVLGHASISTTQRYVHVAKDHLLATLRHRHPNHHLKVDLPTENISLYPVRSTS
jgi:site-specific recombinase XerD